MHSLRSIHRVISSTSLPRIFTGVQYLHSAGRPELVIFDKNGTLVDFHHHWSPWIQEYVKRLERETQLSLKDQIYERLDICPYTGKVRSGLAGHGASWQIRQEIQDLLLSLGVEQSRAQWLGNICWQKSRPANTFNVTQLGNITSILDQLRSENIQIALCTSDTRWRTVKVLDGLGVGDKLDYILCGDDKESRPKPDRHNVLHICNTLGVNPAKACLIGDTPADMEMGRAAGLASVVGVLTGVGNRLELSASADCVVKDITEATKRIMNDKPKSVSSTVPDNKITTRNGQKASLVIFDKDGTLLCFNTLWSPWMDRIISDLERVSGLNLRSDILRELGYCNETKSWKSGLFAEGTDTQIQTKVSQILQKHGIHPDQAQDIIHRSWTKSSKNNKLGFKQVDNPLSLFRILKDNGIKVAVCTADNRASTEDFLQHLDLLDYVDAIVCGDDKGSVPKPAAKNALTICSELKVDPAHAIMIGDTTADLGMGRSAQLGATVGVLSGVGRVQELDPLADHVIPSIKHVLDIALPGLESSGR